LANPSTAFSRILGQQHEYATLDVATGELIRLNGPLPRFTEPTVFLEASGLLRGVAGSIDSEFAPGTFQVLDAAHFKPTAGEYPEQQMRTFRLHGGPNFVAGDEDLNDWCIVRPGYVGFVFFRFYPRQMTEYVYKY
jgi:hypothetical protein